MVSPMPLPKLSRLSILALLASALPAAHSFHLAARQNPTCGGTQGLSQCGSGFPSDFCCPTDTTCTPLNTTNTPAVICCPKGADCSFIQTITCDAAQMNSTLHPDNQIHIANTTTLELPKCGSNCCPLGYSCSGNSMCIANSKPAQSSSTAAPTASPSRIPAASQTTAAPPAPVPTSPGFDGKAFVGGLFTGIVLGGLGVIGLMWFIKKRRDKQEGRGRYSGDFGPVSRTISDPIYNPQLSHRTDFARQVSRSNTQDGTNPGVVEMVKTSPSQVGGVTPKIKSLWERTPKLGFGSSGGGSGWQPLSATGLPAQPKPAVRAKSKKGRDPYSTPTRTPARTVASSSTRDSWGSSMVGEDTYPTAATSNPTRRPSQLKRSNTTTSNLPPRLPVNPTHPQPHRSNSSETIPILMRPPSFLAPPPVAPGMRERGADRYTQDSTNTTFTKLMERAGYGEGDRRDVRDWNGGGLGVAR